MFEAGVELFSDVLGTLLVVGLGLLADSGGGVIAVVVFCRVGGGFGFELLEGSVLVG